jgi:hypothetical protein
MTDPSASAREWRKLHEDEFICEVNQQNAYDTDKMMEAYARAYAALLARLPRNWRVRLDNPNPLCIPCGVTVVVRYGIPS